MLKGTLDDFSLADIFKLLSFSKKTGRVELVRKAGMGRVFFRDGDVYYAESSLSREPLGQKLIRDRALTEIHLRQALDEHADSGERVGQILLREGWINEEQLELAVKQQIEDAVFDLLRWELGELEWEPGVTLEPEVPISVSVENLIMEASRRLDELGIISRKVPSSQAVVAVTPAPPEGAVEINITPDEWRVLVLVDGRRTVETIANTIALDEFHTMRIVHGMVSAGLIEVVGEDATQVVTAPPLPPIDTDVAPPPPPPPGPELEGREVADADGPVEEESSPFASDESEEAGGEPPQDAHFEVLYEGPDEGETLEDPPAAEGAAEEAPLEAEEPVTSLETPQSPPEEWFADPDLSMELFDSPSAGDLATEEPSSNGRGASEDAEMDAGGTEDDRGPTTVEPDGAGELIDDHTLIDVEPVPEPERHAPPPPPIAPVEGADRSRAVRELSDLFDEGPVERPKRPAIRTIDPATAEGLQKRRVEDDEQVTKSLISRLIEGVKGL